MYIPYTYVRDVVDQENDSCDRITLCIVQYILYSTRYPALRAGRPRSKISTSQVSVLQQGCKRSRSSQFSNTLDTSPFIS